MLVVFACMPLVACFALFPLEGYGPGGDGASDGQAPDGIAPADARSEDVVAHPDGRIVFVTRATMPGAFGGVDAGDDICIDAGRHALVPGRYLAWLSDGTTSPSIRFGPQYFDAGFDADNGAIVEMDGTPVASSFPFLVFGGPRVAIVVTEDGKPLDVPDASSCSDFDDGGLVWTDTEATGNSTGGGPGAQCQQWSSEASQANIGILVDRTSSINGKGSWSHACARPCSLHAHLYCFEQ